MSKRERVYRRGAGLIVMFGALLAGAPSAGAQVSVVVSASSPARPSERDIVEMFVGLRTRWPDGRRVQLVDQEETPAGHQFYSAFLRQPASRVRRELTRLVFSGEALPVWRLDGSPAVKRAVAANPQSIGYIATSSLDETVREVYRIAP
jgi:hypothetical protein